MWSYYGTKKRLAKYYPKPQYDVIVEPFAGAGQYSLFGDNWKKEVILVDKYELIVNLWKWLINVSEDEILSLPILQENDTLDNYPNLSQESKNLIGFYINKGSACPKKKVKKFNGWHENRKQEIANNLKKIRHWKVFYSDYKNIPNKDATWYIDPPYQFGGEWYHESNKSINYIDLANWCKERNGQVIVCENSKATWLPFKPLVEINGQKHKTLEVIYTQNCE
jgi:hypothetical protein